MFSLTEALWQALENTSVCDRDRSLSRVAAYKQEIETLIITYSEDSAIVYCPRAIF